MVDELAEIGVASRNFPVLVLGFAFIELRIDRFALLNALVKFAVDHGCG